MTWVRIDDHFDEHPKLAAAGTVCWGVWLAGIAYCNRNLTDGFIPWTVARNLVSWDMLEEIPDTDRDRIWSVSIGSGMHGEDLETQWVINRLCHYGLWDHVDGGYRIHDYHDFQPSKEQVLSERKRNADRQKKHREERNAGSNGVTPGVTNGGVTPAPYPVPVSVPVPFDTYVDPPAFYLERTRRKRLSQKEKDWLEDLHARYSRGRLVEALRAVSPGPDYLKRVDAYLAA